MKLCRFQLASEPGASRSGMLYEGRVYETQGADAVAVHEGSDIRLLSPIERAGSVRLYGTEGFAYANPYTLFGPSEALKDPNRGSLTVVPSIAWLVGGHGERVDGLTGDELILGFCLAFSFRTSDTGGQSTDAGIALGPVLVTPDEFDDAVSLSANGRAMPLSARFGKLGDPEMDPINFDLMPGAIIAGASQTVGIREADLFLTAVGQIENVGAGDEVFVASERLGALRVRILE